MRDLQGRAGRSTSITIMRPAPSERCCASTATAGSVSSRTTRWLLHAAAYYVRAPPARQQVAAELDAARNGAGGGQPSGQPAGRVGSTPGRRAGRPRAAPGGPAGHAGRAGGRGGCSERVVSGRSGFPPAYLDRVGSSFTDFLAVTAPDLLPGRRPVPQLPGRRPRAARHDDRRRHLRRRRPHGRRPPRHHGQPDLQPRHREGLPGRLLQRHRHRRRRGHRDRDGPALPGRARALREDRGAHAVPRRQGQPARRDDPRQPRRGAAGPRRRPAVRRLRPRRRRRAPPRAGSSATTSPAGTTRSAATPPSAPARCSPRTR